MTAHSIGIFASSRPPQSPSRRPPGRCGSSRPSRPTVGSRGPKGSPARASATSSGSPVSAGATWPASPRTPTNRAGCTRGGGLLDAVEQRASMWIVSPSAAALRRAGLIASGGSRKACARWSAGAGRTCRWTRMPSPGSRPPVGLARSASRRCRARGLRGGSSMPSARTACSGDGSTVAWRPPFGSRGRWSSLSPRRSRRAR